MDYHLYFHDDFDGVSSGAILLDFLKSRGDNIVSFQTLNYSPDLKANWPEYQFQEPFILVDFLYHPRAAWWFDHHLSAFIKEAWQNNFVADSQHDYNPSAKSCAGQILKFLERQHGYKPPEQISELGYRSDVIDAAGYKTAEEAFSGKVNAINISGTIKGYRDSEDHDKYTEFLIKALSQEGIDAAARKPEIKERIERVLHDLSEAKSKFKDYSQVIGDVIFIDNTEVRLAFGNTFPYYIYPDKHHALLIKRTKGGFHVNFGENPWNRPAKQLDMAAIAQKYDGGGHRFVGALEVKSKAEADRIASEIINHLNSFNSKKTT